jgi:hypothetical protein
MSRRLLSLRGNFNMVDNALQADQQIFSHESNDLTRGWEIISAYVWPKDTRAEIGSADGQFQACFSLATDTINRAGLTFTDICDAGDNRQVGWLQAGYQLRASAVADFLANSGNPANPAKFVLDPQTVVTNGLWLNCYSTSDSSTSPAREWNYMVVLKPKKLAPMVTILQMIKTRGQDVDN